MGIKFKNKAGKNGLDALKLATDKYLKALTKTEFRRMEQATIVVEGQSKRNIRTFKQSEDKLIDTGRMINSITHQTEVKGNKIIGVVGTNLDYAPFQELGTATIPPRPFLRPSLLQKRSEVRDILARGINEAGKVVDKK